MQREALPGGILAGVTLLRSLHTLELALSTINLRNWRGITWSTDLNWSHNANKITALAGGLTQDVNNVWFVGQPINIPGDNQRSVFYDWKYIGVWQYADTVLMKQFNANGSGAASTTYVTDFVAALPAPSVALTVNTCVPTPRSTAVAAAHVTRPEPPVSSHVKAPPNTVPCG